jgi:hypothetical protein
MFDMRMCDQSAVFDDVYWVQIWNKDSYSIKFDAALRRRTFRNLLMCRAKFFKCVWHILPRLLTGASPVYPVYVFGIYRGRVCCPELLRFMFLVLTGAAEA